MEKRSNKTSLLGSLFSIAISLIVILAVFLNIKIVNQKLEIQRRNKVIQHQDMLIKGLELHGSLLENELNNCKVNNLFKSL
jgi:hypothetical protein